MVMTLVHELSRRIEHALKIPAILKALEEGEQVTQDGWCYRTRITEAQQIQQIKEMKALPSQQAQQILGKLETLAQEEGMIARFQPSRPLAESPHQLHIQLGISATSSKEAHEAFRQLEHSSIFSLIDATMRRGDAQRLPLAKQVTGLSK